MWKGECTREKIGLKYDHPEVFLYCFWQKKPRIGIIWIIYRSLVVLYFSLAGLVIIVLRHREDSPWYKNPIFLYYWVYALELFAFVLALGIIVKRYKEEKEQEKNLRNPNLPPMQEMPWHFKLLWVSYTTAASNTAVFTLVFCLFLYSKGSYTYLTYAIITHVGNTVTILIDFLIAAIPIHLLHVYFPLLFSVLYGVFTYVYQSLGGTGNHGKTAIYPIFNWKDAATAAKTCSIHLACILLAHCLFFMLHMMKHWIKKKRLRCKKSRKSILSGVLARMPRMLQPINLSGMFRSLIDRVIDCFCISDSKRRQVKGLAFLGIFAPARLQWNKKTR